MWAKVELNNEMVDIINHIKQHNKELNFPEGFVIERLIAKHFNEKIPSVEEHFKQIKEECSYSKEKQEKKWTKICKIYNSFLDKLLIKNELFFKGEKNEKNN